MLRRRDPDGASRRRLVGGAMLGLGAAAAASVAVLVLCSRAGADAAPAATTTTAVAAGPASPPGCPLLPAGQLASCLGGNGSATLASPVAGAVGAAFRPLMEAGTGIALRVVTGWVADSASWLLHGLGDLLDDRSGPTRPQLRSRWFDARYDVMARLAAVAVTPILLVALVHAIVRQDVGAVVRATFVHLPLALLLAFVAVKVVAVGVELTDALSTVAAGGASTDAHKALTAVAEIVARGSLADGPGAPLFVGLVMGGVVVLAGLLLWVELVLRAAAIYVAVLFLPLALAAFIWPVTAHWSRRLAETLAALVLSKFVVVAVLALGFYAFQSGALGQSVGGGLVPGASLLLLAAFAPYVLLRLVPLAEAGALAHMEGVSRRAVGMTGRTASSALGHARAAAVREGPEPAPAAAGVEPAVGVPPAIVPASTGHASEAPTPAGPEHPPPPSEPAGPPAPGDSSGAAEPDIHFPGRPSFRVALEQLGGLDVGPVPGEDPSPDDGRS
ncbi:MAG TPA: hypothetical protein VKI19_06235 [Acidimicrobiales bacterium]|nr:hypothetical protein [Acidimicrobiales bacterium]